MTDYKTPICDLIESLLSRGLSPGDVLGTARPIEAAMVRSPTTDRVSVVDRREKERLKKQRQRAAKAKCPPGTKAVHISSSVTKTQNLQKKETESESPSVPGDTRDDWPENFGDAFWDAFPKFRRAERAKVYAKLEKLRRDGFVDHTKKRVRLTWASLSAGLQRYVDSEPGEFAKAPLAWLNAHYWLNEFHRKGGSNGTKTSGAGAAGTADAYAAAAARRFGGGDRDRGPSRPADPVQPADRPRPGPAGPGGGKKPPVDFDNGFER